MKTNYFNDCNTLDDAKTTFRKLCHVLHPDKGGTHAEFIELKKQFDNFRPTQEHARKGDDTFNKDDFYNTVMQFANLRHVYITFIGSFIWLEDEEGHEGSTKDQKEEIKKIKLIGYNNPRWSRKRSKWFYSPEGYKQKFSSKKSFDELKYTWGHKTYQAIEKDKTNKPTRQKLSA